MTQEEIVVIKAGRVKLRGKMSLAQALELIFADCLHQISGNARGVCASEKVECVHQMRVGLRRLRSACTLFRRVLVLPPELKQEIAWLGAALGPARDWEVLASSTLPRICADLPPGVNLDKLQARVQLQAGRARKRAALAVKDARFAIFLADFQGWVRSLSALPELQHSLRQFATPLAIRKMRRLQDLGQGLLQANQEQRHALRISAKKVRYLLEFFSSLYPAPGVMRYVASLSRLQDELGLMNDAYVADGLLAGLAQGRAGLQAEIAWARGWMSAKANPDAWQLQRLWSEVEPLALEKK